MTNLLDFILDLFRSPASAASYVQDPDGALRSVGLQNVSAAQFQAVAASAAPAGVLLGGGNPVQGLQHAVANYHNIPAAFSPQTAFAPQTDFASHNATELASNNDFMSPDQAAGANAQNGAFNLGFGDITLGDKTTNTANGDGAVVVGGDNDGDIVSGEGAVLGDNNDVNNGDILTGAGSNVAVGSGNEIDDRGTTATGGAEVISGNEGPVIKDVDMSGGHGGSASSSGGGGLLGIGNGGNDANAGGGGSAGSIILTDSHSSSVGGNQTATQVDGDVSGAGVNASNSVDNSDHSVDNSGQDHSVDNSDNSNQGNYTDNSEHDTNNVDTEVDASLLF